MSSTFTMVLRLLYLEAAIKLHEQLDRVVTIFSATGRTILRLLKPVMEPFMSAQKLLEGKKYVTGSLFVPPHLRPPRGAKQGVHRPRTEWLPSRMWRRRWGSGKNVLTYPEGKRLQS